MSCLIINFFATREKLRCWCIDEKVPWNCDILIFSVTSCEQFCQAEEARLQAIENAAAEARARRMSRVSVIYSVISDVINRDVNDSKVAGPRKSVVSMKRKTTRNATTTTTTTTTNISEGRRNRRPSRLYDRVSLKSADSVWYPVSEVWYLLKKIKTSVEQQVSGTLWALKSYRRRSKLR